jgi:hypothetical protein
LSLHERIQKVMRRFWHEALSFYQHHEQLAIHGSVSAIQRYSPLYRNPKLRGEVYRYHELGSNLVVQKGRWMAAGLIAGNRHNGIPLFVTNHGLDEFGGDNPGWVIRGMGLGVGITAETNADTMLETPIINPITGTYYHPIHSITFSSVPNTSVIFTRMFDIDEPDDPAPITEYALFTGVPAGHPSIPVTSPPGPAGGPYMFSRKTAAVINKDNNFTLEVNWEIEF